MSNALYYIGLMSGTSLDAIDAVLVDFSQKPLKIIDAHSTPLTESLKNNILNLSTSDGGHIDEFGALHTQLGYAFANTILHLLKKSHIPFNKVKAIGCPGQTIYHNPHGRYPFTLQAGDANIIAVKTGITTIADFRGKDMALGGQGAPLAPVFHKVLFRSSHENRAVINIGGIANMSLLPADSHHPVTGFDIGPGNILLNAWITAHQRLPLDKNGEWAAAGKNHPALLESLLKDPYFLKSPPKSTGREYFNLSWLDRYLEPYFNLSPQDIQNTLTHLTAKTIAEAVKTCLHPLKTVILCGGGAHNRYLLTLIQSMLPEKKVITTYDLGIDVRFIEAALFAFLAKQRLEEKTINLCAITGAQRKAILGAIYSPH
jgi:anhydro-N-acetylmuramic acid kinase